MKEVWRGEMEHEMGSDGGGWSVRWRDGSRAGDDGGL